jgi:DNA-binding NtrC family response regulator
MQNKSPNNLESFLDKKKKIVENVMHKFLGISIKELNEDITSKLEKKIDIDFFTNTKIPFKKAKQTFVKAYIEKILFELEGNITETAKILNIDRRTIHRIINKYSINIESFRHKTKENQIKYQTQENTNNYIYKAIETSLKKYDEIIHPNKMAKIYEKLDNVASDLINEYPVENLTLKNAEKEFEKNYLKKALKENNYNENETAKKIGIRYETLHRKIKPYKK